MNLREIELLLDSLNTGKEYIEEVIQEREEEGYIHLSRIHLMRKDLADVENAIKWLKRKQLEVGYNTL